MSGDLLAELDALRRENNRLRKLLRLTDAEAAPARGEQAAWFDKSPGPVDARSPSRAKVEFYAALFGARRDVYAVRWENAHTGKSGWLPAVQGGWGNGRPATTIRHRPLTPEVLVAHLTGEVHIGLYPMLPGDQTCWLAADFDGPGAMLDALAYLKAARAVGAPAALEVSRSGVGAHVWVFFTDPCASECRSAARERTHPRGHRDSRPDGLALLRPALSVPGHPARARSRKLDRRPAARQVTQARHHSVPRPGHAGAVRRPVGLPVQRGAADAEPKHLAKLARSLRGPAMGPKVNRAESARSTKTRPNPASIVHLRLDGGVTIPASELTPALHAALKHAAPTYNPEFYDRQRRRQSTWNVPRIITSYDETLQDHLVLPRGLRATATGLIEDAGSTIEVDDRRITGARIALSSAVELGTQQEEAIGHLLPHDLGLLVAPPGSGKTVMACAVIAERAVPTLALVDRKTLADQWRHQIANLLGLKPGQLGGGRSRLTGVVDIATLQTLARRTDLADVLNAYGQVIVDECHHIPAAAFEAVVRGIPARYWIGLTATPYRRDKLDDLIGFQLGPARHTFQHADPDTFDGVTADRPRPVLVVHATTFRLQHPVDLSAAGAIAGLHRALADDEARNRQIRTDVVEARGRGRHCLVLAQRTGHVDHLAAALSDQGLDPVVLKGGMGAKQRAAATGRIDAATSDSPLLVVATGHYVGEGFDCPALDTLFLAGPVSFKGRLVQFAGRILRAHPGKRTAEVHDYHDVDVPVLAAALTKRAPGYASLGFPDPRTMI